ncbi:UNVERIFIED_CONTAM: hypothetical protein GTU68_046255 [Idotea baltica]|nr:hypothetical protein [Idotea baltica]
MGDHRRWSGSSVLSIWSCDVCQSYHRQRNRPLARFRLCRNGQRCRRRHRCTERQRP